MGRICGNSDEEIPHEPGEWTIRSQSSRGASGPYLIFGCPLKKGSCGVPLAPSAPLPNGALWTWDGNTEAPTVSPSINCTGGCGWHGYMKAGTLVLP